MKPLRFCLEQRRCVATFLTWEEYFSIWDRIAATHIIEYFRVER